MYVSVRTYRVGQGSIDDLMHRVDRDLAESFAQEPGFVAYQVARTGDRAVASITFFREREQAEASNELAAQWVAEELADFEVDRCREAQLDAHHGGERHARAGTGSTHPGE